MEEKIIVFRPPELLDERPKERDEDLEYLLKEISKKSDNPTLKVKLLAYTPNPVDVIYTAIRQCHSELVGDDLINETLSKDSKAKESLIRKVIKLGHWSIIEHVNFTFLISGISRASSHQLVRHRLASYSQQSQRYVKQVKSSFVTPPKILANKKALEIYDKALETIMNAYNALIDLGIPKEDVRFILPNATTTALVMTMNCRELRHFLKLRLSPKAQWEIRELARQILSIVKNVLPCVFDDISEC